jgi:hypothetical protein
LNFFRVGFSGRTPCYGLVGLSFSGCFDSESRLLAWLCAQLEHREKFLCRPIRGSSKF